MADTAPKPTAYTAAGTPALMTDEVVAANVTVAMSGAVYVAPTGTSAPTDASTALAAEWVSVGYLSEDAVSESISVDTNDIVAWQNADTVRKVVTSFGVEYQFTMIETNKAAVELYYGKTVDGQGKTHTIGGSSGGKKAFVIDAIDSSGQHIRRFIPSGEVTERGEVSLSGSDAIGYEVTIAAYPDASLSGDVVKVFYTNALT